MPTPFSCFAKSLAMLLVATITSSAVSADESKILLEDHFERTEADPDEEQIGNGWTTNSKKRAQGVKQVDLADGAMHITRAAVADHGVSVVHDLEFTDAVIELRFKIDEGDDLGINIADMNEKSVHAGHLCVTRIRPTRVEITDLKTGNMNLATREKRLSGKLTAAEKKTLAGKTKRFPIELDVKQWHQLEVRIEDDTMSVAIDGKPIGQLQSPGIDHPTKSRLRLAVNRHAWVDDVVVKRLN